MYVACRPVGQSEEGSTTAVKKQSNTAVPASIDTLHRSADLRVDGNGEYQKTCRDASPLSSVAYIRILC